MRPGVLQVVLLGLLCGLAGFRLGWRLGNRWLLPVFEGALGFLAFAYAWTTTGPRLAFASVLCWAAGTTLVSLYFFVPNPEAVEARVLRVKAYREEMLVWLRSGRSLAPRPLATAGRHLHELVVYLAAAVLTANFASLVLGAVLLNTMNAWVAGLLRAATRRGTVALLAWNVWSVVRVASYVALGVALAAPLALRLGYPAPEGAIEPLVVGGAGGVVLDLVLKLALSGAAGRRLSAAVDLVALEGCRGPEGERFTLGLDVEERR